MFSFASAYMAWPYHTQFSFNSVTSFHPFVPCHCVISFHSVKEPLLYADISQWHHSLILQTGHTNTKLYFCSMYKENYTSWNAQFHSIYCVFRKLYFSNPIGRDIRWKYLTKTISFKVYRTGEGEGKVLLI